jgi:subtilase family serine protease
MLGILGRLFAGIVAAATIAPLAGAQTYPGSSAPPMINLAINNTQLVPLPGNIRPEATNAQNDRGPVASSFAMPHMLLQLKRSPAQEQALETLIDQQHDPASPNFHKWLMPTQIGAQFGLAASDLQKITGWLTSQGFQVNLVYPNGSLIDFSGTAGQVTAAFHTAIHNLSVNGEPHFANMSDPQIPAALAPAVAGVVSLNDFRPKPQFVRNPNFTFGSSPTNYAMTPPTSRRSTILPRCSTPVSAVRARPSTSLRIPTCTRTTIGRRSARRSDWRAIPARR